MTVNVKTKKYFFPFRIFLAPALIEQQWKSIPYFTVQPETALIELNFW